MNTKKVDRYAVNDDLAALADRFGIAVSDDVLNELTHHVADVMETAEEEDR